MRTTYMTFTESMGATVPVVVYGGAVKSSSEGSKTFTLKNGTDGQDVLGGYTSDIANEWTFVTTNVGIMFPDGCAIVIGADTTITLFYTVAC